MARYQATVAGGLFAQYANALQGIDVSWLVSNGTHKYAAQALAHKGEFEFRQIVDALVASGVGATATKVYAEVAPSAELGGLRAITQTSIINRATTANDAADARKALTSLSANTTFGASPPINWDRNPLGTR